MNYTDELLTIWDSNSNSNSNSYIYLSLTQFLDWYEVAEVAEASEATRNLTATC